MRSINIITTTMGRDSLPRLIDSFYKDLNENDFFTVISDRNHEFIQKVLATYNFKCSLVYIKNDDDPAKQRSKYGHDLINMYKSNFKGDFLMFADDDDRYVENILGFVREQLEDLNTMYIFKHKWGLYSHWNIPIVENIGKCMVSIPNIKEKLPFIEENVLGDLHWFPELEKLFSVKFINKIIYLVRDTEL